LSRGYRWQEWDGKVYMKAWIKGVRKSQVQKEKESANFKTEEIDEI
jgi:hypothetical protein